MIQLLTDSLKTYDLLHVDVTTYRFMTRKSHPVSFICTARNLKFSSKGFAVCTASDPRFRREHTVSSGLKRGAQTPGAAYHFANIRYNSTMIFT